jgi:hypothetical protein
VDLVAIQAEAGRTQLHAISVPPDVLKAGILPNESSSGRPSRRLARAERGQEILPLARRSPGSVRRSLAKAPGARR